MDKGGARIYGMRDKTYVGRKMHRAGYWKAKFTDRKRDEMVVGHVGRLRVQRKAADGKSSGTLKKSRGHRVRTSRGSAVAIQSTHSPRDEKKDNYTQSLQALTYIPENITFIHVLAHSPISTTGERAEGKVAELSICRRKLCMYCRVKDAITLLMRP